MAAQRTETREQTVAIGRRMMGHMMEHMSDEEGMNCPMMKELAVPAALDHSQHRPEK